MDKTTTRMIHHPSDPWKHPYKAIARCEDGTVRTVRLNQEADTWFSWPGRTTIQGKSIRGYVTQDGAELRFISYKGVR